MSTEEKNLIIVSLLLGVVLVILLGVLFFTFYSVKKRMYLKGMNAERIHQKELNAIVVETQSQVLNSIGQELHDNIGQKLTMAILQVDSITNDWGELEEKQQMLIETLRESIQDLRRISRTLNPCFIEEIGFHRGIEKEVYRLSNVDYIKVHLETLGVPVRLDFEVELVLFRVFQESFNNSLKHSQAKNLSIKLIYDSTCFKMMIIDDGVGFDLDTANKGSGLRNIHSHAKHVNADLLIESDFSVGTKLSIVLTT